MIDLNKAQNAFKEYLKNFDINDGKTKLKMIHTYKVMEQAGKIAEDLKLSEEEINLAKLIGLLHDIGRFEQAKKFNDFRDYNLSIDHANFGCDLLFKENLIRNFIEADEFDNIIYKAIYNHNKLNIEEGLSEKELLHSKIIRDADKVDNFRVKQEEKLETLLYMAEGGITQIENETISPIVYESFMNSKLIINTDRKTPLDHWISYTAFIFDFNFKTGLKYIKDNDYINRNINRINYKNPESKRQMENIRKHAIEFIEEKLGE